MRPKVEYLGHLIDRECIRPIPAKVSAIRNAPAPKNVKELLSFPGLVTVRHQKAHLYTSLAVFRHGTAQMICRSKTERNDTTDTTPTRSIDDLHDSTQTSDPGPRPPNKKARKKVPRHVHFVTAAPRYPTKLLLDSASNATGLQHAPQTQYGTLDRCRCETLNCTGRCRSITIRNTPHLLERTQRSNKRKMIIAT